MYENEREQLNKLCGEAFNITIEITDLEKRLTAIHRKATKLYHDMDKKLDESTNNN